MLLCLRLLPGNFGKSLLHTPFLFIRLHFSKFSVAIFIFSFTLADRSFFLRIETLEVKGKRLFRVLFCDSPMVL